VLERRHALICPFNPRVTPCTLSRGQNYNVKPASTVFNVVLLPRTLLLSSCAVLFPFVHQEYAAILEDHGLDYMTQSRNRMRKLAILWVAIIRHAREMELVDGPLDDRYILEDEGLDWGRISRIALELAPPDLRDMYTKSFCFSQFHSTSTRFFSQQMLYSWNWDRLECKSFLYSCHHSA
jgi:hypothetical protein